MRIPREGKTNEELKPVGTMIKGKIKRLEARVKALEKANAPCSDLQWALYCFVHDIPIEIDSCIKVSYNWVKEVSNG